MFYSVLTLLRANPCLDGDCRCSEVAEVAADDDYLRDSTILWVFAFAFVFVYLLAD